MPRVLFLGLLMFCLTAPLLATVDKLNAKEDSNVRQFLAHKKGNVPPQVRKCLGVTCQPGLQCFHGRCIKHDEKCAAVKCQKGFRCVGGNCLPRKHKAKQMVCAPLGFKLEKQLCDKELKKQCKQAQLLQPVCGFNPKGKEYHDYASPCDACSDKDCKIKFFYGVGCVEAPRVCGEEEECMNGVCTGMFQD
jgi:hypothetical protein